MKHVDITFLKMISCIAPIPPTNNPTDSKQSKATATKATATPRPTKTTSAVPTGYQQATKYTSTLSVSGNDGTAQPTKTTTFITSSQAYETDPTTNHTTPTIAAVIGLCLGLSILICVFLILRRRHIRKRDFRKYVTMLKMWICKLKYYFKFYNVHCSRLFT